MREVRGNIIITGSDAHGNPVSEAALVKPRRRLSFNTWKLDFYSFAVDLTIKPGYWITLIVRTGRRVLKWEYWLHKGTSVHMAIEREQPE